MSSGKTAVHLVDETETLASDESRRGVIGSRRPEDICKGWQRSLKVLN